MKTHSKFFLAFLLAFGSLFQLSAQAEVEPEGFDSTMLVQLMAQIQYMDSVESLLHYDSGTVVLGDGIATLTVPDGYKFLNPEQSIMVLNDIWGNLNSTSMGMLFRSDEGPFSDSSYAINITFDEAGYVEDDDADDIDYEELLETMQEDTRAGSKYRQESGLGGVELIGWASQPYYDKSTNKLHWAKELAFEGQEDHTLNYNLMALGRKGYLEMNFIAEIFLLDEVKQDIPKIIPAVSFNEGHRYSDFDPDFDTVAAIGIGGLIAGKVLKSAGLFAVLGKFAKFILIGIAAAAGAIWRFITGRSKKEEA